MRITYPDLDVVTNTYDSVIDRTSPAHTDAEGNPRDWRGIPSTPSE